MAEIAVAAAKDALAAAGKRGEDVDMVLCAAVTCSAPTRRWRWRSSRPSARGYGYDMNVACSSATFAIEQAVNALRCGTTEVRADGQPEITSAHLEWRDRDCHFIFGDVHRHGSRAGGHRHRRRAVEVLGTKLVTQFSNNIRNNAGFMNRCGGHRSGCP